jgi:hypothetical protein
MGLEIIGAGWGRTGTHSLYLALQQLGYRPHHMREVFEHLEQCALFLAAAEGRPDWDAVYRDYDATVDWPGASFWRELVAAYPDAKVILSVRDPQDWYESFAATIQGPILSGDLGEWSDMVRAVINDRDFDGRAGDRAHAIAAFERHNAEVVDVVDSARLLVFRASDGWGPLCEFLGVPVPDGEYPRSNDRASFGKPEH